MFSYEEIEAQKDGEIQGHTAVDSTGQKTPPHFCVKQIPPSCYLPLLTFLFLRIQGAEGLEGIRTFLPREMFWDQDERKP